VARNVVPLPATSHSTSRYSQRTQGNFGAVDDVYDEDDASFFGVSSDANGGGTEQNSCYVTSEHTWTGGIKIDSCRVKMFCENYSWGDYANRGTNPMRYQYIQLKVNGSWTTVWSYTVGSSADSPQPNGTKSTDQTVSTGWENVTGIRAHCYAASYAYEGDRHSKVWAYIYEIEAWSPTGGFVHLI